MPRSAESKKKRIVIFTQGPDPAIVCDENGHVKEKKKKETPNKY